MRTAQLVECIAAILATIANLILIPIILTKSSVKMGPYKYFLLAYTVTAAVYSYCVSISLFTWYLPKNGFLFICTVEIFPRWFYKLHAILFDICFLNTMMVLVGSFLYRLSTLQNSIPWMAKRRFAPVAVTAFMVPVVVATCCSLYMSPSKVTEEIYREEVLNTLGLDLSTVYYMGGSLIINGQLHLPTVFLFVMVAAVFSTAIVVCIICWLRIGSKLKELRSLTNSSYKYHHNFYILLTLQTCVPLLFYATPLTAIIIMGFAQISIEGFSDICSVCLSFAQLLDPLLTIYYISDYKRFLLRKTAAMLNYAGITVHSIQIFNIENSSTRNQSRIFSNVK